MERMVCLEPERRDADWTSTVDAYHTDLWGIQPTIQVAGVGENDTIVIERAWGGRIELDRFTDVAASKPALINRLEGVMAGMAIVPNWVDWLAKQNRRGRFKNVLPRLFAFEGFLPLGDIEEKFFGDQCGILAWSKNGSVLSRHGQGKPIQEPKLQLAGDEGRSFAGLETPKYTQPDVEAQDQTLPRQSSDSILKDGWVKTYPVVGLQPWIDCSCKKSPCVCKEVTDKKLMEMGKSKLGEDKVSASQLSDMA